MRRAAKVLAMALLGVVVLGLLVTGGAVTLARTSWGAERLRRMVLPRLNATLAGQVDVRRLRFHGNRIVIDGLALHDPAGDVVAAVARLDVAFSPLALFRRRIHLRAITVDGPKVHLRQDDDGSNLGRALAAKAPRKTPRKTPRMTPDESNRGDGGPTRGFDIQLDALVVRDGTADLRDSRASTAPGLRYVHVDHIGVKAAGRYGAEHGDIAARLDVSGGATAPLPGPVRLVVDVKGRHRSGQGNARADMDMDMGMDIDIDAGIGSSVAHLIARAQSAPRTERDAVPVVRGTLTLERARIEPALIRLLAPQASLETALTVSGRANWDGATRQAAAHLELAAAGASVTVSASGNVGRQAVDGVSVRARSIDLARLITNGPKSDLSFDLEAHGALDAGRDLASLRGALKLQVPVGHLGGYALGPIRLNADADRGRYKVTDFLAVLPGVRLSGAGEATTRTLAFSGAVDLQDLGATVKSVTAGSRSGSPRAGGQGRIDVALRGSPAAPSFHARGRLTGLAWQNIRVPTVALVADIPDLRTPIASTVSLNIPRANVGARAFRGLMATIRATGPRVDARVSMVAPESIQLEVGGVWRNDSRTQIDFDRLTLRTPETTWALAQRMRVGFDAGILRVSGFDWRDGGSQAVRLDLEKTSRNLRADVTLSAIEFGRLPPSLLPANLKLGGQLSAEAHVRGRPDRPQVDVAAKLVRGRVDDIRDIAFTADAQLRTGRVAGHIDLGALGANVNGRFDVPLVWPPPAASPLAIHLTASNIDLVRATATISGANRQLADGPSPLPPKKPPRRVQGTAALWLDVDGTGAHPQLNVRSEVRRLAVDGRQMGDVTATLEATGKDPVRARVELRPAAGVLQTAGPSIVVVRTGFSLGGLLRHTPSMETVLTTPLHVEAHVDGVKLGPLAALADYPHKVGGSASLELALDGTPRTPSGKMTLTVDGLSTGRFPATDGELHLESGARDMRADARVSRRGATLFSVVARVDAPAVRLRSLAALADVPVQLHAVLGPLELQRVGLPPETDRKPARVLKGRLHAEADLTGTLRSPRFSLHANAGEIRLDKTMIGQGQAAVTYADRTLKADVNLVSANGGRLHLLASTNADLGYPAITRGLDPRRLVVAARLDAKGFDVSGLSGATPGLRTVAGQLFAGVDVTGTAADPRVSGRLEWKDGGLTITGMGEYKNIHFLAHGAQDHVVLDEFRASSGGGQARITGSGDHQPGAGYAVKTALDLKRFPAYVDGQALAAVSLQASADGQVSVQNVRAKVSIREAHLTLNDAKRKHLQKLAAPSDVVLTDAGTPLNPVQARKLAALRAALAALASETKSRQTAVDAAAKARGKRPAGIVVTVDAPRNLWVSGKDANLELGFEPGFRVETTDDVARVYGQVVIKRGRMDVVGRRFDLKAGSSVRFAGPSDAPELDVSAKHVNEQERITVWVTVKGTPGRLQMTISAPDRPDLTETQLYTLIVTGRLDLGGGAASSTTTTDRAASLVGGLLATQLQKSLSKKLPFDVLTIEAGNSLGATRLEAGTYVTPSLYVGYVGRLGADPALLQNRNAVHLEYEFASRWSFQGEYGDAKTGSADVIWTKRY